MKRKIVISERQRKALNEYGASLGSNNASNVDIKVNSANSTGSVEGDLKKAQGEIISKGGGNLINGGATVSTTDSTSGNTYSMTKTNENVISKKELNKMRLKKLKEGSELVSVKNFLK